MDDSEITETDIWASPSQLAARPRPKSPRTPKTPKTPTSSDPVDPEVALRRELEGVRKVNEAVEGIIATLERTGSNMTTVSNTVGSASTLLNTWTRILSQTEHNQRLLLHPNWKGVTEDLAAQEAEAIERQQAAERRALEEEQRREEIRRRRDEEEEKRRLGGSTSLRGRRGSRITRGTAVARGVRGSTRASTTSRIGTGSSYLADTTASSTTSRRGTSGIGRGIGSTRSRARGAR